MYADKYVHRPSEIPKVRHWAIIKGSSHTDSYGDTGYHIEYQAYLTKDKWEAAINVLEQERGYVQPYVALEVNPAEVIREVKVKAE